MKELVFEGQINDKQNSKNLVDNSIKKIPKLIDKSQEYTYSFDKSIYHLYRIFILNRIFDSFKTK